MRLYIQGEHGKLLTFTPEEIKEKLGIPFDIAALGIEVDDGDTTIRAQSYPKWDYQNGNPPIDLCVNEMQVGSLAIPTPNIPAPVIYLYDEQGQDELDWFACTSFAPRASGDESSHVVFCDMSFGNTTNKEAIVFDLEDILKQLNIEEQVATVGLVIEKDEAEVEAIAQTIQDDYPNMYLQAKEYGRNLTLACAELPNPTNPDIVTYLYAGDDATETDSWIAKVNNTIRAQGDNSERLIHIDSNLAAVVEANETEQGYYASTVSQHDKATNEMLSF